MSASTSKRRAPLGGAAVDELRRYLEDELALQREMLQNLEEKERLLVLQDRDGLGSWLERSRELLERMEALTRRRAALFAGWSDRMEDPRETLTVSTLVDQATEEHRAGLARLRDELREVLEAVKRQNLNNQVLVRTGLEVNQAVVHAVFGGEDPRRTYDRSARGQYEPPARPIVNQEL